MQRTVLFVLSLMAGFGAIYLVAGDNGGLTRIFLDLMDVSHAPGRVPAAVRAGLFASTGLVAGVLLFLVPTALFDGSLNRRLNRALEDMVAEEPGKRNKLNRNDFLVLFSGSQLIEQSASRYAQFLVFASKAEKPPPNTSIAGARIRAAEAFDANDHVERGLLLWLIRGLAWILIGASVLFALATLIAGISPDLRTGAPAAAAGTGFAINALLVLCVGLAAALVILSMTGICASIRQNQVARLCRNIDDLFGPDSWEAKLDGIRRATSAGSAEVTGAVRSARTAVVKAINASSKDTAALIDASMKRMRRDLVAAVEKSLKGPLQALSGDQSKALDKLVNDTLKAVKSGLQQPLSKQAADLEKSLKSTTRVVTQMQKNFENANAALAKRLSQHEADLAKGLSGYTEELTTMVEAQAETASRLAELSLSLEKTLNAVPDLLGRIATGQEALHTALEEEATAAQVIAGSSKELSAAAQASRQSLEQFVSLAENLKAVSRALQSAGAAQIAEGGPKADNLSQAIRDLKKSSEQRTLPKL